MGVDSCCSKRLQATALFVLQATCVVSLRWDETKLCPSLDGVDHARVMHDGLLNGAAGASGRGFTFAHAVGSVIEFGCDEGFFLHGTGAVTCESTGTWSAMPLCSRVNPAPPCPPVPFRVGMLSLSFRQAGVVTRRFLCKPGFTMVGAPQATCTTGAWSSVPQCIPAPPETPELVSHSMTADLNPAVMPLQVCHGDCDHDGHCAPGLTCHQQNQKDPIPGCAGVPHEAMDYCVGDGPAPKATKAAPALSGTSSCIVGSFEKLVVHGNVVSTQCTQCPAGKFGPGDGECHMCDRATGATTASPGSAACVCMAGWFGNPSGKARCYTLNPLRWINCKSGSTGYAAPCRKCPAGTHASDADSLECIECTIGQYARGMGSTQCQYCNPGKFGQLVNGSPGCVSCPAGKHQAKSGARLCRSCDAGKFMLASGAPQCKACAAGKYQSRRGGTNCYSPRACSHVKCRTTRSVIHGLTHSFVKTWHHKAEQFGIKHKCEIGRPPKTQQGCVCVCW